MASGKSSLSTDLRHHLTELSLWLRGKKVKVQYLETVGMLTGLQKLDLGLASPNYDMAGQTLVLILPHLVSLTMYGFEQGGIALSCPKLTEAHFEVTKSLHLEVEYPSLDSLTLNACKGIRLALHSHKDQLQNLGYLRVVDSTEIGKHLIEDVSQMRQLWYLEYLDFPATCMPASFPQSLQHLELMPLTWAFDLPGGIKELRGLTAFCFYPWSGYWELLRPLCELLPINCLKKVDLGSGCRSSRKDLEAMGLWSKAVSQGT